MQVFLITQFIYSIRHASVFENHSDLQPCKTIYIRNNYFEQARLCFIFALYLYFSPVCSKGAFSWSAIKDDIGGSESRHTLKITAISCTWVDQFLILRPDFAHQSSMQSDGNCSSAS